MMSHKQDKKIVRTAIRLVRKVQAAKLREFPMDHEFPKNVQRDLSRLRELFADKEVED